jgi:hypothetical protein
VPDCTWISTASKPVCKPGDAVPVILLLASRRGPKLCPRAVYTVNPSGGVVPHNTRSYSANPSYSGFAEHVHGVLQTPFFQEIQSGAILGWMPMPTFNKKDTTDA